MTSKLSRTKKMLSAGMVGAALLCGSVLTAPAAGATTNDSTTPPEQDTRAHARIVGGQGVPNDAYPFIASLEVSGQSKCGGSLLGPTLVITAAHCVTTTDPLTGLPVLDVDGLSVVVGRTVLSDATQGQERGLSEEPGIAPVAVHPRYLAGDSAYDVAFLALDAPVEGIVPVRLPTKGTDALLRPGQNATVIGWGNTDPTLTNFPDRLREVQVPMLETTECELSYGSFRPGVNMCAGVVGKDSCQGDSGGPLFRQPPARETAYQIGVVSYGDGCGAQGAPGVYVSLSSAALWDTMTESASGKAVKTALGR